MAPASGVTAEARGLSRVGIGQAPGLAGSGVRHSALGMQGAPKAVPGMSEFLHGLILIGDQRILERAERPLRDAAVEQGARSSALPAASAVSAVSLATFAPSRPAPGRESRVTLDHAALTWTDAPFHEELTTLATQVPGLDYHLHLSRVNPCQPRTAWI